MHFAVPAVGEHQIACGVNGMALCFAGVDRRRLRLSGMFQIDMAVDTAARDAYNPSALVFIGIGANVGHGVPVTVFQNSQCLADREFAHVVSKLNQRLPVKKDSRQATKSVFLCFFLFGKKERSRKKSLPCREALIGFIWCI